MLVSNPNPLAFKLQELACRMRRFGDWRSTTTTIPSRVYQSYKPLTLKSSPQSKWPPTSCFALLPCWGPHLLLTTPLIKAYITIRHWHEKSSLSTCKPSTIFEWMQRKRPLLWRSSTTRMLRRKRSGVNFTSTTSVIQPTNAWFWHPAARASIIKILLVRVHVQPSTAKWVRTDIRVPSSCNSSFRSVHQPELILFINSGATDHMVSSRCHIYNVTPLRR